MGEIILLSGFLGAGKTTTVKHLKQQIPNARLVVNDIANTPIDAQRLGAHKKNTISGCACCKSFTQLKQTVDSHKSGILIIESSGAAQANGMARAVAGRRVCWIACINAASYNGEQIHEDLVQHIKEADIVMINKTDKISKKQLQDLESKLMKITDKEIVRTSYGKIDVAKMQFTKHENQKKKLHKHRFKSIALDIPENTPAKIINQIANIEGLRRAKGSFKHGKQAYEIDISDDIDIAETTESINKIVLIGTMSFLSIMNIHKQIVKASQIEENQKYPFYSQRIPKMYWQYMMS